MNVIGMAENTVKFDFKEFTFFTSELLNASRDFNQFIKDFLNEMANRFLRQVIKRTPVDTGNLRNSWVIEDVTGDGIEMSITIANSAEYADFVEYGHHGKYVPALGVTLFTDRFFTEGKFMMKLTAERIRWEMPKRLKKAYEQWVSKYRSLI
jgi:hypothetical protein